MCKIFDIMQPWFVYLSHQFLSRDLLGAAKQLVQSGTKPRSHLWPRESGLYGACTGLDDIDDRDDDDDDEEMIYIR